MLDCFMVGVFLYCGNSGPPVATIQPPQPQFVPDIVGTIPLQVQKENSTIDKRWQWDYEKRKWVPIK